MNRQNEPAHVIAGYSEYSETATVKQRTETFQIFNASPRWNHLKWPMLLGKDIVICLLTTVLVKSEEPLRTN